MTHPIACVFALIQLTLVSSALAADWPEFRGPTGDGHVAARGDASSLGLPLEWSESNNVRWKTEIPHRGWSTPVVMDGQVWLTTATEDGHDFYASASMPRPAKFSTTCRCSIIDSPEPLGNNVNCYAAPSPAIEPGRVYVHFGSFGTACLDTSTGEVLWKRDDLPCRHYRGPSSSVVLFENLVILTFDGADYQYVTALDKATGETVWKTDRDVEWNDENLTGEYAKYADMAKEGDFRKAHSTPLVVDVGGQSAIGERRREGDLRLRSAHRPRAVARPLRRLVGRTPAALRRRRRLHRHRPDAPRAVGRQDRRRRRRHRHGRPLAAQDERRENCLPRARRRPDLHGQRRRRGQLRRRGHAATSSGRSASAAGTPRRRSSPMAESTSSIKTAKRPSSSPDASTSCSPPTSWTTASWPRPQWPTAPSSSAPNRISTASSKAAARRPLPILCRRLPRTGIQPRGDATRRGAYLESASVSMPALGIMTIPPSDTV